MKIRKTPLPVLSLTHNYFFKDLEKYVKEVNPLKQNLILLNKADYLTEKQRLDWAKYLKVIAFILFY